LGGLEGLIAARDSRFVDAERLRREADIVDGLAPFYDRTATGAAYGAFAELLRIAALLVQWRAAILTGEADSDRFLRAAKERHRIWKEEGPPAEGAAHVVAAADGLADLSQIAALNALLTAFASTPLPIGIYTSERSGILWPPSNDEKELPPPELAVAFLKFAIDGQPASETHFLTPRESHDLELEVRVSRWPEGAETLELRAITIEAASAYDFPLFKLARPEGQPPFALRERGRAIITAPQGLNARPFEFRYSASFKPVAVEQPVVTLGQRTLRIESIDLKVNSLTGYPGLDSKVIEIRDVLRSRFNIPPDDLGAAVRLAVALAAYMGRVLQDNEIATLISEEQFQALIRAELRRRPEIGSALSEHPRAAGGITDLTLQGVPLELKVEREKRLTLEDCQQFVGQTTSYAHGNGKRVGVLCVLDCSPKTQTPAALEDCIGALQDETSGENSPIIAVLVQANLAKPSLLSR
jgi:hypothetical protein